MLYDNGEKSFVLLSGVGEDMGKYLHKPCVKTCRTKLWFISIFLPDLLQYCSFKPRKTLICNTNNTNHTQYERHLS